jgi:hypothetical protein
MSNILDIFDLPPEEAATASQALTSTSKRQRPRSYEDEALTTLNNRIRESIPQPILTGAALVIERIHCTSCNSTHTIPAYISLCWTTPAGPHNNELTHWSKFEPGPDEPTLNVPRSTKTIDRPNISHCHNCWTTQGNTQP